MNNITVKVKKKDVIKAGAALYVGWNLAKVVDVTLCKIINNKLEALKKKLEEKVEKTENNDAN